MILKYFICVTDELRFFDIRNFISLALSLENGLDQKKVI